MEIREAGKFGIAAQVTSVDFSSIMARMRAHVAKSHDPMQQALDRAGDSTTTAVKRAAPANGRTR